MRRTLPGKTPSPRFVGSSSLRLEEHLHADADAEERLARADHLHDRLADGAAVSIEAGAAAAEGALAGHDDLVGACDPVGVRRHDDIGADEGERLLDAAQVAAAGVGDGDVDLPGAHARPVTP